MTSLEDTDEDFLDDPIQLMCIEEPSAAFEKNQCLGMNQIPEDRKIRTAHDEVISNHRAISPHVSTYDELLHQRKLVIKLVDCLKYSRYYKNVKRSDQGFIVSSNTAQVTELFDKNLEMVKIRPVATPYQALKVGDKISLPKAIKEDDRRDIAKQILIQTIEPRKIDFKKNVGLIGLKVTRTNEIYSNLQQNEMQNSKHKKLAKNAAILRNTSDTKLNSEDNMNTGNVKKSENKSALVTETEEKTVKSVFFVENDGTQADSKENKSLLNLRQKNMEKIKKEYKEHQTKLKNNNDKNNFEKDMKHTKSKLSENANCVQKWVDKRKLMNSMKAKAVAQKLQLHESIKSNDKNKKLSNREVAKKRNHGKDKKQEVIYKSDDNPYVNPKNITLMADKTLVVNNKIEQKIGVKDSNVENVNKANCQMISAGVLQNHVTGPPKPPLPITVGNSHLGSFFIEKKYPEQSIMQHNSVPEKKMNMNNELPASTIHKIGPNDVKVDGNIARVTMSVNNVPPNPNNNTPQVSRTPYLLCQNAVQIINQTKKITNAKPSSQNLVANNIQASDNIARPTMPYALIVPIPNNQSPVVPSHLPYKDATQMSNQQSRLATLPNNYASSNTQGSGSIAEMKKMLPNIHPNPNNQMPITREAGVPNQQSKLATPQKQVSNSTIQVSGNIARITIPVNKVVPNTCEPVTSVPHSVFQEPVMKISARSIVGNLSGQTQDIQSTVSNPSIRNDHGTSIMSLKEVAQMSQMNYTLSSLYQRYRQTQQASHIPHVSNSNETNKSALSNMNTGNPELPMPSLSPVAPVNRLVHSGLSNQSEALPIETVVTNRLNSQQNSGYLSNGKLTQHNVLAEVPRLGGSQEPQFPPNRKLPNTNYVHCSPIYEGYPQFRNFHSPNTAPGYWNGSPQLVQYRDSPPYPSAHYRPPPPYTHLVNQLRQPPKFPTQAASSTKDPAIIGENMSGPVRKISLGAVRHTSLNKSETVKSNVISDNLTPVTSKTEMLKELSKVIDTDSPPQSPDDLNKPDRIHTATASTKSEVVQRYRPGPLSKKPKLESKPKSPDNQIKAPVPHKGYSPPILPIPSFQQSYERFNITRLNPYITQRNFRSRKEPQTKKIGSRKLSVDKSVKKISLNEYKKRIEKPEEKSLGDIVKEEQSIEGSVNVREQMKESCGFQISVS